MSSKLFVGNLPFKVTKEQLVEAFSQYGSVLNAKIVMDRKTNRSRGYGFIEFEKEADAEAAIEGMNEQDMGGRTLTVSQAKTQE